MRALAPTTATYLFPAMNTLMYEHPLTAEHLRIVTQVVGYHVVGPIGKHLACGDIGWCCLSQNPKYTQLKSTVFLGIGAMTEWRDIVKLVVELFNLSKATST